MQKSENGTNLAGAVPTAVPIIAPTPPAIATSTLKTTERPLLGSPTRVIGGVKRKTTMTQVDESIVAPDGIVPIQAGSNGVEAPVAPQAPCIAFIDALANNPSAYPNYDVRIVRVDELPAQVVSVAPQAPYAVIRDWMRRAKKKFPTYGIYELHVYRDGAPTSGPASRITLRDLSTVQENESDDDSDPLKAAQVETKILREKTAQAKAQQELEKIISPPSIETPRERDMRLELERLKMYAEAAKSQPQKKDLIDILKDLAPLIAIIAPILRPDNSAIAKALESVAVSSEKAAERNERNNDKIMQNMKEMNEKMLASFEKKSTPENSLDQYLKMEERVVSRLEKFGAFEKNDEGEDRFKIDPNSPVMSVLWQLVERGVNGLASAIESGNPVVEKIAANIVSKMGAQATLPSGSPVKQAAFDAALQSEMRAATQPRQIAQRQQRPANITTINLSLPPRKMALPPSVAEHAVPPVQLPQVNDHPATEAISIVNEAVQQEPSSGVRGTPPPHQVETPAAQPRDENDENEKPFEEIAAELIEDDIKSEAATITDIMAQDILSGRCIRGESFLWINDALSRWPEQWKHELLAIAGTGERDEFLDGKIQGAVRERAGKSWGLVYVALMNEADRLNKDKPGEGQYLYNNFQSSFGKLIEALREQYAPETTDVQS